MYLTKILRFALSRLKIFNHFLGEFKPGALLIGEQWQAFLDKINCYACGGAHDDDKIILCDGTTDFEFTNR